MIRASSKVFARIAHALIGLALAQTLFASISTRTFASKFPSTRHLQTKLFCLFCCVSGVDAGTPVLASGRSTFIDVSFASISHVCWYKVAIRCLDSQALAFVSKLLVYASSAVMTGRTIAFVNLNALLVVPPQCVPEVAKAFLLRFLTLAIKYTCAILVVTAMARRAFGVSLRPANIVMLMLTVEPRIALTFKFVRMMIKQGKATAAIFARFASTFINVNIATRREAVSVIFAFESFCTLTVEVVDNIDTFATVTLIHIRAFVNFCLATIASKTRRALTPELVISI